MISEKFNFMMELTQTRNSAIGRALSFDPSYIGRIRTGKRGVPLHQPFLEPASHFFAKAITRPYQQKAASDAITPGVDWPSDVKEAEKLILQWFLTDKGDPSAYIGAILGGLSLAGEGHKLPAPDLSVGERGDQSGFYYGRAGKKAAVEAFLSSAAVLKKPVTLLLCSDEDFSWMYDDPAYFRRWLALMLTLIQNGSRVRIIHTVSRGIGEMLEAVKSWMPLYSTGAIEPYYYPRLRDGIYHRTLFIAQGTSAVFSTSVGGNDVGKLNVFTRDRDAVNALEAEFSDYLALCRPLMRIYNRSSAAAYAETEKSFFSAEGELLCSGPICARLDRVSEAIKCGGCVTQFLSLRDAKSVARGVIRPLSDFYTQGGEAVSARQIAKDVRELARLLGEYESLRVIITDMIPDDVFLCVKEDCGVLFNRITPPSAVFHVSEPNMTASFYEYLSRLDVKNYRRAETVAALESYAAAIEAAVEK